MSEPTERFKLLEQKYRMHHHTREMSTAHWAGHQDQRDSDNEEGVLKFTQKEIIYQILWLICEEDFATSSSHCILIWTEQKLSIFKLI